MSVANFIPAMGSEAYGVMEYSAIARGAMQPFAAAA
jgi:hypothetical protein